MQYFYKVFHWNCCVRYENLASLQQGWIGVALTKTWCYILLTVLHIVQHEQRWCCIRYFIILTYANVACGTQYWQGKWGQLLLMWYVGQVVCWRGAWEPLLTWQVGGPHQCWRGMCGGPPMLTWQGAHKCWHGTE